MSAPNGAVEQRLLWDYLLAIKESIPGIWVLIGDINEVRDPWRGETLNLLLHMQTRLIGLLIGQSCWHTIWAGGYLLMSRSVGINK